MSNTTTAPLTSNSAAISSQTDFASKRYSLVKWLENSQFDAQNEWLGRLTSVSHTNIIDFDADELKAGIEINVIRNNGEIWRAQVIIPKTASNTIDLPPSSYINLSTAIQLREDIESSKANMDHSLSEQIKTESESDTEKSTRSQNLEPTKQNEKSEKMTVGQTTNNNQQKEWQFLQTAINDAGLTDFYQTYNELASSSSNMVSSQPNNHSQIATSIANSPTHPPQHPNSSNVISVNDMNIETILQMQCELLDQQKELKTIELETMDHLRQLHQNISKLVSKFNLFEMSLQQSQSVPAVNPNNSTFNNVINTSSNGNFQLTNLENSGLKVAKNTFNKLNATIGQQLKLVDNELLKELCQTQQTTTVSLLSPTTLLQTPQPNQQSQLNSTSSSTNKTQQLNETNFKSPNTLNSLNTIGNNNNNTNSNNSNTLIPLNSFQMLQPITAKQPTHYLNSSSQLQFNHKPQQQQQHASSSSSPSTSNLSSIKTVIDMNESNNLTYEPNAPTPSAPLTGNSKVQGIQTQISLNRFLRESVKQQMGRDFLVTNAVSDIPSHIMRSIKKEAFEKYLPNDRRPIKAWGLAMASLRCLKRDLVRNRNKQLVAQENLNSRNKEACTDLELNSLHSDISVTSRIIKHQIK